MASLQYSDFPCDLLQGKILAMQNLQNLHPNEPAFPRQPHPGRMRMRQSRTADIAPIAHPASILNFCHFVSFLRQSTGTATVTIAARRLCSSGPMPPERHVVRSMPKAVTVADNQPFALPRPRSFFYNHHASCTAVGLFTTCLSTRLSLTWPLSFLAM